MKKLVATFFYKGSAAETVYRRVEVLSICEVPLKLFGYETNRDTVIHQHPEFKSYTMDRVTSLGISQVRVQKSSVKRLSDQLRAIADELEKEDK